MHRKIIISLFAISLFMLAGKASAQMGMMGSYYYGQPYANTSVTRSQDATINNALQDIYKTQNIDNPAKVDCSKVTDNQFGALGDAYMGIMLPNQQQHEIMDNMMGGEGSSSLSQAHINIGRSYLGCWSNYNSGPVYMPMMGGYYNSGQDNFLGSIYPMMYGNNIGYSMMGGWNGYGVFGMVFSVILWIFAIFGLVSVIKFISNKHKKS